MATAQEPRGSTHGVEPRPDSPVDDGETSFAVWTHTTMLENDTDDDLLPTTILRGID